MHSQAATVMAKKKPESFKSGSLSCDGREKKKKEKQSQIRIIGCEHSDRRSVK